MPAGSCGAYVPFCPNVGSVSNPSRGIFGKFGLEPGKAGLESGKAGLMTVVPGEIALPNRGVPMLTLADPPNPNAPPPFVVIIWVDPDTWSCDRRAGSVKSEESLLAGTVTVDMAQQGDEASKIAANDTGIVSLPSIRGSRCTYPRMGRFYSAGRK
jgi:hypothetical protein